MSGLISSAALLLALGSGLVTGVLWAFSDFLMRSLAQASQGGSTMQVINAVILRSSFISLFLALALVSLVVIVMSLLNPQALVASWFLAGGLLYLVGVFGVTMVFNVPLNNGLLAATPQTLDGVWATYLRVWTLWNHVRVVAGVGSSLAFMLAFRAL